MTALVSIIMPVYNVERYISEAIDSVIKQDYAHWELLIIDNASTDNSMRVARSFTHARIHFLEEKNAGVSNARNKGIDHASGEFICFLDADDMLSQNSLSIRLNILAKNKTLVACDGKLLVYDDEMKKEIQSYQPSIRGNVFNELYLLQPRCFSSVSWMIRADAVQGTRFPVDWNHFEDRLFFQQIAAKGEYDFTEQPVYFLRRRKNSSMTQTVLLDKAYQRFIREIQFGHIDKSQVDAEIKTYHTTFIKTYLRKGLFIPAINHLLRLLESKQ